MDTCSDASDLDFVSFYDLRSASPFYVIVTEFIVIVIIFFRHKKCEDFILCCISLLCSVCVHFSLYLCDTVNASPLTFRLFIIRQCHLLDDMVFRYLCEYTRLRSTTMLAHARLPPLRARHFFDIYISRYYVYTYYLLIFSVSLLSFCCVLCVFFVMDSVSVQRVKHR